MPSLTKKRQRVREEANAVIYTGLQGPKIVLKEILEAGKQGHPHYGFGTDVDPYVTDLPHALDAFIRDAKKLSFEMRLIFAEGFKSPNPLAEIRYLPKEFFLPVRIMVYDNKVAIADFTKPVTTIIIEKREIAEAFKKHFKLLWRLARQKTGLSR